MNENYSGKSLYDSNYELTKEDVIILKCIDRVVTKINSKLDNMNKGLESTLRKIKEVRDEYKRGNPIL